MSKPTGNRLEKEFWKITLPQSKASNIKFRKPTINPSADPFPESLLSQTAAEAQRPGALNLRPAGIRSRTYVWRRDVKWSNL